MGNPITAIEFQARDFGRLKAFYSELFDWDIDEPNEWNWAQIRTGSDRGAKAAMVRTEESRTGTGGAFFFVEVPDLRRYLARAVALGATVVVEPWDEVGIAVFVDPEGNRVGLTAART